MKINGKIVKNWLLQGLGLMFSWKRTLIFDLGKEKREGLHMWFVFFAIDVYFLDRDRRIIEIKKGLKPFTFYFPERKARYILETPYKLPLKTGMYVEW